MTLRELINLLREIGLFKWLISLSKKDVPTEQIEKAYEDASKTKDPSDIADIANNRK